jgi:hypothetical protein
MVLGWRMMTMSSTRQAITAGLALLLGCGSAPALAECITVKYRDTPVCLDTFKCVETPQSSFVRKVCFDAAKSYVVIKLNNVWYYTIPRRSEQGCGCLGLAWA